MHIHAYDFVLLLPLLPCVSASRVNGRVHAVGDKRRDEELFLPGAVAGTIGPQAHEPSRGRWAGTRGRFHPLRHGHVAMNELKNENGMKQAPSRRAVLASGAGLALGGLGLPTPGANAAVKSCPSGAKNCYSSTSSGKNKLPVWQFPAGESKGTALQTFADVVGAYPQEGQADVDKGGWSVVSGDLKSGNARLEFKSGLGNFAKFFNGGQPFIDDVEFELQDSGVAVFSSSRVGESDLGVNQKRLNWIASRLRAKGWDAPEVPALG